MESIMKYLSLLFLLVASASAPTSAQTQDPIRLQCDGKYHNYAMNPPVHDVEVRGIYVEIYSKDVRVLNAPAFEATYLITRRDEASIFFQFPENKRYIGVINRLSGALNLTVFSDLSNTKMEQSLSATCRRAQPLF